MSDTVTACITLANTAGLHARPSVQLTRLAKTFACNIDVATSADGPWLDAKSPVKMMRLKAPQGAVLHVRASGQGAGDALASIVALIEARFPEAADSAAHD
jgi:phosphocarrier protein